MIEKEEMINLLTKCILESKKFDFYNNNISFICNEEDYEKLEKIYDSNELMNDKFNELYKELMEEEEINKIKDNTFNFFDIGIEFYLGVKKNEVYIRFTNLRSKVFITFKEYSKKISYLNKIIEYENKYFQYAFPNGSISEETKKEIIKKMTNIWKEEVNNN